MVYGAGPVGIRKASYLAREAKVSMIDRRPAKVPEGMELIIGEAKDNLDLIEGSDLVVAATGDRATDELICTRAGSLGKPFNRSDGPGGFLIPSLVERRNYTVAISTLGRSPGMSRHIRDTLEASLPPVLEDMVDLTEVLRERLKKTVQDPREREGRIHRLLEDAEVWELLETDPERAFELAERKVMD